MHTYTSEIQTFLGHWNQFCAEFCGFWIFEDIYFQVLYMFTSKLCFVVNYLKLIWKSFNCKNTTHKSIIKSSVIKIMILTSGWFCITYRCHNIHSTWHSSEWPSLYSWPHTRKFHKLRSCQYYSCRIQVNWWHYNTVSGSRSLQDLE